MRNCMENLHAVDGGGHGINDDHQIDHDEETVSWVH